MAESIEEKVYRLMSEHLALPRERLAPEVRIDDLSKDSIQLFGLILAFEKEFQAQATYEDLMQIETVGDIINYLKRRSHES